MALFNVFKRRPIQAGAKGPAFSQPSAPEPEFTREERMWLIRRPSAFVSGNRIIVASRFTDRDRMKLMPGGKYDGRTQTWSFPHSIATADVIREVFGDRLSEAPSFKALTMPKPLTEQHDGTEPIPLTKTKEWAHQREAFWFGFQRDAILYHMGMGTGKSKVTADLLSNRGLTRVLIICPNNVVNVWPKQIAMHAGLCYEVVCLNEGSVAEKADYARRMITWAEAAQKRLIFVINYESAWRAPFGPTRNPRGQIIERGFALTTKWDAIVLDESHRAKSPSGQIGRFCRMLRRAGKLRVCLTGTPMPHSPLDIWSQFAFLDPTIFGESFGHFKKRIAVLGGYKEHEVLKWINQEWFASQLGRITFHVGREVLDLPPAQHITREAVLNPKAAETYRKLEEEFYAELDEYVNQWDRSGDEKVSVTNVLVKLLRCQQITSGYVRDDTGRDIEVDTAKQTLLEDILEDIPSEWIDGHNVREPVVVFARFQHDLESIQKVAKKLGLRYKELSGRHKDLGPDSTFPAECDVFGVQVQSGGVGIDLTAAHYAVYYSIDRSLGNYDQTLARLDRPGQKWAVIYYHLLARLPGRRGQQTIDHVIYQSHDQRRDLIDGITALMRESKGDPRREAMMRNTRSFVASTQETEEFAPRRLED